MKKKVALLHNIIAPYRFPLFRTLGKDEDLDLTVLFLSKSAKNRKWDLSQYLKEMNFAYKVLPHFVITFPLKEKIEYIINATYIMELICNRYEIIITAGWLDFSCQLTYLLAPIFGYKYIIWSESTAKESSLQRKLTLPFVKWAVRRASACIAIGESSKEYLISLGANPKAVYVALSTVDIDHFSRKSSISLSRKAKLRQQLGITDKAKLVLYVGQFIERKGIDILLEAYKNIQTENKALLLLGYGELKETLQKVIAEQKIPDVHFVSHTEIDELPEYYAIADVFVLPSREETWGLVVNEAMACGLPVVVSEMVGSGPDLVLEGSNGYIFSNEDAAQLCSFLDGILGNEKLRRKMSSNSRMQIMKASPQRAAQVFKRAISSF